MRQKKEYTLEQIQKDKKLLLNKAKELVLTYQLCSIQMIQRKFQIPYAHAQKLVEKLKLDPEIQKFISTTTRSYQS